MAQARRASESEQGQAPYQESYRESEQSEQGGQQMGGRSGERQGRIPSTINIAAVALRSMSEAYDMQLAATRLAWQTQARAAAAFGWPDYSGFFRRDEGRAKRVFATGTEHLLATAQQARQTLAEVQREVGRLIECNAESMAESWQQGLEEFAVQAEESLDQMKELARQQIDEAMQAAESLGDATREAVRQGGEQFRETVRQGAERGREATREASERGREAISEQAERTREQGHQVEEETERSGRRGRAA